MAYKSVNDLAPDYPSESFTETRHAVGKICETPQLVSKSSPTFLNTNGYLSSAVFTLVLKNGSDHLLFDFALCSFFSLLPDYVSVFVC